MRLRATWGRIREILVKEYHQTLRDPRMRVLLIGPPLLQLILFGYAVNLDVENTRLGWMDQDRSPQSRELLAAFQGSRYFEVRAIPSNEREIRSLLDHGTVLVVVRVLPGFGRDIQRGSTASVQLLVDGTNSNTAAIASNYAQQILTAHAARVLAEQQAAGHTARPAAQGTPVSVAVPSLSGRGRVWFNPNLKSRDYFVPGVVVNIIALVTIMLTAMSIVREKEIGTMEQLMVTPIRPFELMIGKILPFAAVGMIEVALVTSLALAVFRVPFRGSVLVLVTCALFFLLSTLGVGLFISTISQTQQQAMMSSFFFFMPSLLLSGFAFPIRNMPAPIQALTYLNPIRYFMEIVRGVFLKGTGLAVLWPQIAALLVFGVTILGMSALRFHKRLD
jgi:ABC-2 type transport system permease protein